MLYIPTILILLAMFYIVVYLRAIYKKLDNIVEALGKSDDSED